MSKQKPDPIGIDPPANDPNTAEASKQTPPAEASKDGERGRQTEDRRPICPYHHKPCNSQRSDAFFTRYYCTEEGCTFSTKVARPQIMQRVRQTEERDRDRPPR